MLFTRYFVKVKVTSHLVRSFSNKSSTIRIVLISDTHSRHDRLGELPPGDLLLHAGDFTMTRPSNPQEYKDFIDWFSVQPHQHKVLISGNRDGFMDTNTARKFEPNSGFWMEQVQNYVKKEKKLVYLEDQALQLEFGEQAVNLFGTPWTAIYGNPGKAFQIRREDLYEKWNSIPVQTDILITHMPPFGIRDSNRGGVKSGCKALLERVSKIQPRIHVFGHIHESYGIQAVGGTTFVNASSLKSGSRAMNEPIVLDYQLPGGEVQVIERDEM